MTDERREEMRSWRERAVARELIRRSQREREPKTASPTRRGRAPVVGDPRVPCLSQGETREEEEEEEAGADESVNTGAVRVGSEEEDESSLASTIRRHSDIFRRSSSVDPERVVRFVPVNGHGKRVSFVYPSITHYWTGLLILDHSYLVGD